jgi:hypothetical protein
MLMRIQPTENTGTAGRAEGRGAKGVFEMHPFLAETINVWRLQMLAATESEGIPALIISEQKEDIRLAHLRSLKG